MTSGGKTHSGKIGKNDGPIYTKIRWVEIENVKKGRLAAANTISERRTPGCVGRR